MGLAWPELCFVRTLEYDVDIRDKTSGILETRFAAELNYMLLKAHLDLDIGQLRSTKIKTLFNKV